MKNAHKVRFIDLITQALGDILLLVEEGLSRLYPREPRKRLSDENYLYNRKRDIVNQLINDQNDGKETGVNKLKIGRTDVGWSGCEIIAIHNALVLLGKESSFADVEREFEISGALTKVPFVPIGAYGSNPYALRRMITTFGLEAKSVSFKWILNNPGIYVFSYWNYGGLLKGLHTILLESDGEKYRLYNYGSTGQAILGKDQYVERFKERFIIGYDVHEKGKEF